MQGWRDPSGGLPFFPGALHVWLIPAPREGAAAAWNALSAAERARTARFVFEQDRLRYAHQHAALRAILALYTGLAPECVPLAAGGGGKPVLAERHAAWRFNLAHSGAAALCAVCRGREVGVDLEADRRVERQDAIAARYFAPSERQALGRLPAPERAAAFLACWTRKEAVVKACGAGLRARLQSFAVPVEPGGAGPWTVEGGWTLLGLPEVPGYFCAVAVEGGPLPLYCWRFAG